MILSLGPEVRVDCTKEVFTTLMRIVNEGNKLWTLIERCMQDDQHGQLYEQSPVEVDLPVFDCYTTIPCHAGLCQLMRTYWIVQYIVSSFISWRVSMWIFVSWTSGSTQLPSLSLCLGPALIKGVMIQFQSLGRWRIWSLPKGFFGAPPGPFQFVYKPQLPRLH